MSTSPGEKEPSVLEVLRPAAITEPEREVQESDNEGRSPSWRSFLAPCRARYDPKRPLKFSLLLNALFSVTCTFSVANLYYCQPLLIQLSQTFHVSDSRVSRVPTLLQAGYVVGLLFITPMGDLVRRRPLVIASVAMSASLSIGLASTSSVVAFEALSFLTGVFTIASPILIPLAADLAPPERRASAMSIVLSGYLLGIVIARVLAGVIAEFSSWRIVYYVAIGVQYAACLGLYAFCPDYPAKNTNITYFGILWTMAKLAVTEPLLVQTYLILLLSDVSYITFWVTLTFILGQSPYHYSTLVIGLFGLIGLFGVLMAPLIGRFIDRLVPWYSALIGTIFLTVFWAVETGAAGVNIAAVIVVCLGLDFSDTMQQLSLMSSVLSIDEGTRSRLNAIIILAKFIGQLIGTSVSTKIYVDHGWRPAAAFGLGCMGLQLLLLLLRGPHCERYTWLGYQGGYRWKRDRGREVEGVTLNEQLEEKNIEMRKT